MSDISGLNLPLDVKAKLAELDLELSEGWLELKLCDDNVTPEAVVLYAEGRGPDMTGVRENSPGANPNPIFNPNFIG